MFKTFYLPFFLLLQSTLLTSAAWALPEKDTGNLGEIRYSVLTPENFQRIYGDAWIPMDGRNIETSDLYREGLWSAREIPDARGRYLRTFNGGRSPSTGNPHGDENQVGQDMNDQFGSHHHEGLYDRGINHPWANGCYPGHDGKGYSRLSTSPHGSGHSFYTGTAGGSETRPRSVIVYTYIKINRTPENMTLNLILEAIEQASQRVFQSPQFQMMMRRLMPAQNPQTHQDLGGLLRRLNLRADTPAAEGEL
jgi:hypothetical protein